MKRQRVSKEASEEPEVPEVIGKDCSVCLETIEPVVKICENGHEICMGCLTKMRNGENAGTGLTCPICRSCSLHKCVEAVVTEQYIVPVLRADNGQLYAVPKSSCLILNTGNSRYMGHISAPEVTDLFYKPLFDPETVFRMKPHREVRREKINGFEVAFLYSTKKEKLAYIHPNRNVNACIWKRGGSVLRCAFSRNRHDKLASSIKGDGMDYPCRELYGAVLAVIEFIENKAWF